MLESKTIAMLTQTVTAVMLARKGEMNSSATFFRMGCFVSWMLCFFYLSNIRMCKYTVPSIWGQNLIVFFFFKTERNLSLCSTWKWDARSWLAMLKNCQVLCKKYWLWMYALTQSFEWCVLLYVLPCKRFSNVKVWKNGIKVSSMHSFAGCQPLSLMTAIMNLLKGEYLSLEISIAAHQHRWITCLAFFPRWCYLG